MRALCRIRFVSAVLILLLGAAPGRAQEPAGEFHLFNDKDGKQVEARILSISDDKTTMKIVVRAGHEYDIPLERLSLGDQIYVKQWLEARALAEAKAKAEAMKEELANRKYQVLVTFQKQRETEQLQKEAEKILGSTKVTFSIGIKNAGPDPAPGLTVEYLVLTREGVKATQEGDLWKWEPVGGANVQAEYRKESTTPLEAEQVYEFKTQPARIDEVFSEDKELVAGDEVLGIFVRVTNPYDKELTVVHAGKGLETYNWDTAVLLAGEGPGAREGGFVSKDSSGALVVEMRQGQTQPSEKVDIRNRRMDIKAQITPDPEHPDGVIATQGDAGGGWALYAHQGQLILLFKTVKEARIETPLPEKQFSVTINFDPEALILRVDRDEVGDLESPGLFTRLPEEPLCVGFVEGTPLSPDFTPPAAYPGKVEGFSLRAPPIAGDGEEEEEEE